MLGRTQLDQEQELDQDRWCSSAPNWTDEIPARARPKSPCGWCPAAPNKELHQDQELEQDLKYRRQSARIRNYAWIRSAAGGKHC